MKTKYGKYLFSFVLTLWASALSAQTHWSVDVSQYSGHMTIYYSLTENGHAVDLTNYEIAAFVDDECRGVGTVISEGENTCGRLFVYGNDNGEQLVFEAYNKSTGDVIELQWVHLDYASDGQQGYPSAPFVIPLSENSILLGDVNGDGRITTFDVTMVVGYILTGQDDGLNKQAADMNGDGQITTFDAIQIVQLILNK